jgi:hypothetical protein
MNFRLFVTAATIVIIPVLAQAQTRPPKPTVADVEKLFKIISSDKAKTQAYCDLNKIQAQLGETDEKDTQKVAELGKKADDLASKIGPEYATLMAGLEEVEFDSPEGKNLQAAFAAIDKLCP